MTHTHLDHIGCLAEIRKEIPHAELWVHKSEAEPLEQGDERTVWGMNMFQSMCQAQYGIKPGSFKFRVDRMLEGGETLNIGDMSWEVLHIPGHSQGSIGLYYRPEKILIPGDVVYADYAIGRFDLHGASGTQHRDSLLSLAELDVDILLPGHNRIMENILNTVAVQKQYFTDFEGTIKPLGAWGGDFILAISEAGFEKVRTYFNQKGLKVVFKWDELVKST